MHPGLLLNDTKLTIVNNHKHLGLTISNTMSWSSHINEILAKAEKRLSIMPRSKHILPSSCLDKLYKSMILPLLDYSVVIYDTKNVNVTEYHIIQITISFEETVSSLYH